MAHEPASIRGPPGRQRLLHVSRGRSGRRRDDRRGRRPFRAYSPSHRRGSPAGDDAPRADCPLESPPMELLTAANQLTLLRLLLVPVFAICMIYGLPGWALVAFGVAAVTDLLDGLIARWTGQLTTL